MSWMLSNINTFTLNPINKRKLINTNKIIIDSKSGYSGAGRGVHKKYKNKNLYESLSAYGVASHRHNSEINKCLINILITSNLILPPIYHPCLEVY